uniref:Zinc transporter ZIP10 n=1 Tax=Macrostomum lignano TaxID=282301 RepID=A0A1I8FAJ6_9PLAT
AYIRTSQHRASLFSQKTTTNTEHKEGGESGGLDHMDYVVWRPGPPLMAICTWLLTPPTASLFLRDRANHRAVPEPAQQAKEQLSKAGIAFWPHKESPSDIIFALADFTRCSTPSQPSRHLRRQRAAAAEAPKAAADDLTVEFLQGGRLQPPPAPPNAAACSRGSPPPMAAASDTNGTTAAAASGACRPDGSPTTSQQQRTITTPTTSTTISEKRRTPAGRGGRPGIRAHQPVHQRRFRRHRQRVAGSRGGPRAAAPPPLSASPSTMTLAATETTPTRAKAAARARAPRPSHSHTTVTGRLAWTVIIGDGLHNFCDGMALGAAFARDVGSGCPPLWPSSVTSCRTSWATSPCCSGWHVGADGLLANLVSSLVCLLWHGLRGVLLAKGATNWVFMVTRGMFLYIALVDMMPELTTEKSSRGPGPCVVFFWQNLGFFIGAGIMLLISLYEHKINQAGVWLIKQSHVVVFVP